MCLLVFTLRDLMSVPLNLVRKLTLSVVNHLASTNHIAGGQMKLSANGTYKNTHYAPYRARPSSPVPWCSNRDHSSMWLAIDLGASHSIDKIELVKSVSDTRYVLTYKVSYRNVIGDDWTDYNDSQVLALMFVGYQPSSQAFHFRLLILREIS